MDVKNIVSKVDHTLLTPVATSAEIKELIDEAVTYGAASVCIPPCYVSLASAYGEGRIPICTVVGFPNGYSLHIVKAFEAERAVSEGASEIDMVINLCNLKNKEYDLVKNDISAVREAVPQKILKVIVETCLLTEDEKALMCKIVAECGADFIKTSTGFSKAGATASDIILFKNNLPANVKIKAAGGIQTLGDAEKFIELGASRLGTSKIIKLIKGQSAAAY